MSTDRLAGEAAAPAEPEKATPAPPPAEREAPGGGAAGAAGADADAAGAADAGTGAAKTATVLTAEDVAAAATPEAAGPAAAGPAAAGPRATDSEEASPESVSPEDAGSEDAGSESATPESTPPKATNPEVGHSRGVAPEDAHTDVARPQGTNPQGTNPQGTNPQGTNPQGTNPQGTNPQGTNPQGTNPQGTNPQGTNPQGAESGAAAKRSAVAEALAAAVRAVESGEKPATAFFNEPRRQAAPARPAPQRPSAPVSPAARPPRARAARPPAVSAEGLGSVREVLAAGGAPEQLTGPVTEALGEHAAEALRTDPWQLLAVPGVRPEQADGFARALLGAECGPADERRAQALTVWLLERAADAGHTVLEASVLRSALTRHAVPDPDEALQGALAEGAVLVFEEALENPGTGRAAREADPEAEVPVRLLLGLDRYAMAEESLADGLGRLINNFEPEPAARAAGDEPYVTAEAAEAAEATAGTAPSDTAGAPDAPEADASGETAPRAADEETPTAGAAASPEPTNGEPESGDGDAHPTDPADTDPAAEAAERPRAGAAPADADADAGTAPSAPSPDWEALAGAAASPSAAELTRAVAGAGVVAHSGGDASRAEVVGLVLAARAAGVRACVAVHTEDGKRRAAELGDGAAVTVAGLLAGREGPGRDVDGALALGLLAVLDAPQLDVEAAAMLVESLADGTRLVLSGDPGVLWSAGPGRVFADVLAAQACPVVVSRTPDPGPIGELVSGIGVGELNQVEAPGKEVVIVPVREPAEAVHRTVQLVADSIPRAIGVPAERTQVITPGHGGPAGTRALNAALKERLNPGPGRFGGFDPGDRVAYVPAPGRTVTGTVVSAGAEGLRLDCGGTPVVIPRERVGEEVRHGWAVTAHQAAGARWPAAVVVLPGDAARTLTRSWVCTAFGRAERHLSVVHGVDQALPRAVAEVPGKERTTRLRSLLRAQGRPAE
ncbi:hypothetical protein AF335_31880 [Streptomyces eurocidicus]|uniref:ATP-dependent RecD2 DNA helicase-like helix-hairpin-helix domain-containing protein n=1 Tax=Streptomyces eurocidicus TaxID=66423 RepID=A0A2N8NMF6_STREU|nr:helix-hairpin-helix domain-containing protein [Streptomyces eurocidicus]PNE29954.1 hypothetical protein AF335_31880 [Streptomyces eurocidicus]